jgi:hypothetical protein
MAMSIAQFHTDNEDTDLLLLSQDPIRQQVNPLVQAQVNPLGRVHTSLFRKYSIRNGMQSM